MLPNTVWPETAPPQAVQSWLESLLIQLDSKDPGAPEKAAALFTSDAEVWGMAGKSVGTAEIINARKRSWDHMEERKHEILRVYSNKDDFSDLLLMCKLSASFKNGRAASDEFVVRIVFRGDTSVDPKSVLYKIYADSLPWLKAIHGKEPFSTVT